MDPKQIFPGDEVKDKFGEWHTVALVYDTQVYTCDCQGNIHSSNIIAVIHPEK